MAVLPGSGSLSIKTTAGLVRSIADEVDGNTTGNKSLSTLSVAAGKSAPHSMLEFYNYDDGTTAVDDSGRGSSAVNSCTDKNTNHRTFYVRTDVGWAAGSIVYTDSARTTPLTGFDYATNGATNRNWSINSGTGALIADDSLCIPI